MWVSLPRSDQMYGTGTAWVISSGHVKHYMSYVTLTPFFLC